VDHYHTQNFAQEVLNINSEVRRVEIVEQVHSELEAVIQKGKGSKLFHQTFCQALMDDQLGSDGVDSRPLLCSLDILAYVYLQEELVNLAGSKQVKDLKERYPVLVCWFDNFKSVILPKAKGTLPYKHVNVSNEEQASIINEQEDSKELLQFLTEGRDWLKQNE